jgi:hypothetical protein
MLTLKSVSAAIDRADLEFRWCWEQLAAFKSNQVGPDFAHAVHRFQPRLLKGLLEVEKIYRSLIEEEKRLIENKKNYNQSWFAKRLAKLSNYKAALKNAIGAGKIIGDAFVWIFYKGDQELLAEHLKRPKQLLLPPNIGGMGERTFVERLQGLALQLRPSLAM